MKLLKGLPVAEKIQADIKAEIASWPSKGLSLPHLCVILVGDDAASQVYVGHKARMCEALGFSSEVIRLDEKITEAQILAKIDELNKDPKVDGILVQLPLPKHIYERNALEKISPNKDVDCLTKTNIGSMVVGDAIVKPCTPAGIIEILKFYDIKIAGKKIAVIGRSQIVGTPLVHLLTQENATVTLFHSKSENLMQEIKNFEIVCVAIGKSEYFKASDFKKGAIVIDVGIHRSEDHKLTGDVTKTPEADSWLKAQSPVPGGVGVTTIAMLMQNTLQACKARRQS